MSFSKTHLGTLFSLLTPLSGFDDRLEDEDYDLIAENTGIQLQRKKFRRVHGNVLDSDEDEDDQSKVPPAVRAGSATADDTFDSTMQDEDFAHVSKLFVNLLVTCQ